MREDYTYFIIDKNSLTDAQISNSATKYMTSGGSLFRESSDEECLIKVKGSVHSCYSGLTSYNYSEIVEELKKDKWNEGVQTVEELKNG